MESESWAREHINLCFYHGADLPDPAGLLEGAEKKLQHVKKCDFGQVGRPSVRQLLEASLIERKKAVDWVDQDGVSPRSDREELASRVRDSGRAVSPGTGDTFYLEAP